MDKTNSEGCKIMHSIKIHLKAITEFHEPKPYEYFPSIYIDVFRLAGDPKNTETLLIHRCEDIQALSPSTDRDVALIAAREYLDANYKLIIQALISKIGE